MGDREDRQNRKQEPKSSKFGGHSRAGSGNGRKFTQGNSAAREGWEEWELTAFVLGELDEAQYQKIARAAKTDYELRTELASLKSTLSDVREAFTTESVFDTETLNDSSFGDSSNEKLDRLEGVFERAEKQAEVTARQQQLSMHRPWMPWLATGACVLVAGWLAVAWLADGYWSSAEQPIAELTDSTLRDDGSLVAPQGASVFPQKKLSAETKEDSAVAPTSAARADEIASALAAVQGTPFAVADENATENEASVLDTGGLTAGGSPGSSGLGAAQGGMGGGMGGMGGGTSAGGGMYGGMGGDGPQPALGMGMAGYGGGGYGTSSVIGTGRPPATSNALGQFVGGNSNRYVDGTADFEIRVSTASGKMERGQLLPLNVRLKELVASVGGGHPAVESVRKQIRAVEKRIAELKRRENILEQQRLAAEPSGDRFGELYENRFERVEAAPLNTFSIDVDSASYAKTRQLLLQARRLPPPAAVRIEEFVNYFDYEYAGPGKSDVPFGAALAVANCPWKPQHKLVRIALQAEKLRLADRPKSNLVFLLDVSGSMSDENKLPLVQESLRMLAEQLGEEDRVSIVVYAGAAGCVLEPTTGDKQQEILSALEQLSAGGSTNGGEGIELAYSLARDNFIEGGTNRVILCTDGDFNVGVTSTSSLVELVEENAEGGVFLTVLGFGQGNTNDEMMEEISNRGNGFYAFVDSRREAYRQMVGQLVGNLVTVAKDVKIQVEFNPERVRSYRLLGYENRLLADQDFEDDAKDAGEIGAGHRVTAFYEIVPVANQADRDDSRFNLRYGRRSPTVTQDPNDPFANELLAVKLRYKEPDQDLSKLLIFPLDRNDTAFEDADRDFRWAASVVEFGMLLRESQYAGNASWAGLIKMAESAAGVSPDAERQECLEMIRTAASMVN
ncbi:MAG: von Willebrand factor type A domain-containing protein [Pirellulaceae bacterium]